MNDAFVLYLLTRADAVQGLMFAGIFVCGFGAFGTGLGSILHRGDAEYSWNAHRKDEVFAFCDKLAGYSKRLAIAAVVAAVGVTAMPSKNDILFIIGGSALLDIAKTDRAKSIGDKTLRAVENWIDQNMPEKKP